VDDESKAMDPDRVRTLLSAAVEALGGSERPGQMEMAEAVAAAMTEAEHLLVQAGTGTGKSLAYLVPALLYADAADKPAIIATATLALQAQLVDRDLPLLAGAVEPELGRPLGWATLKGRSNYACLHRVREGVPDDQGELVPVAEVSSTAVGADVVRARDWAEDQASARATGDRDRLEPGISDRAWAQVSVTAQECLGAVKCPYGAECFAERARERAGDVDVIVTNHALLAIDATEGVPVLPDHDVVVVDEGHELAARVTSIATADLSPGLVELAAKRSRSFAGSDGSDDLAESGGILRHALAEVEPGRLDELPDGLAAAVGSVGAAVRTVQSGFATRAGAGGESDVDAGRRAAKAMVDKVFAIAERMAAHAGGDVIWVEDRDGGSRRLRIAPLSVAALLRDRLFRSSTVVATSATMQLGGSFEAIANSFGLTGDDAPAHRSLDVGSPFDYARQAILYVARDLPPPGRDALRPAALDQLAELMSAAGGRTLGLFSSRRAADEAAAQLRARVPDLPLLCQGDDVVATLVRRFAEEEQTSLFGTLSLWQGVDVPGGACQLVVIDRLPFPRPDDPLQSARQLAVERAGGNGFMSVAATHAALLLAQGAGRLIRRASDRGVVAVLDPRLVRARYGAFLRASLPPMWFTTDRPVVIAALQRLAERHALSGSAAP
jgi:ATP-dependent DNA helicase DinG